MEHREAAKSSSSTPFTLAPGVRVAGVVHGVAADTRRVGVPTRSSCLPRGQLWRHIVPDMSYAEYILHHLTMYAKKK